MHRHIVPCAALVGSVLAGCGGAPPAAISTPPAEPPAEPISPPPEPDPAAAARPPLDPALLGQWLAPGEPFSALYVSVWNDAQGAMRVAFSQGVLGHASGMAICEGTVTQGGALDCSEEVGEGATARLGPADGALEVQLGGEGWPLELAGLQVRTRRIDAVERALWMGFSDLLHEEAETGEPAELGPDDDPTSAIVAIHAALARAGIDPLRLTDEQAIDLLAVRDELADRRRLCAASRCPCANADPVQTLADDLLPFAAAPSWIGHGGVWASATNWRPYLRIRAGRAEIEVVDFPDRVMCTGVLRGDETPLACGAHDVVVAARDGAIHVSLAGAPPSVWRRASPVELLGTQRVQAASEGPERERASAAMRVANTLDPAPVSERAAQRAYEVALEALDAERRCAPTYDQACGVTALRAAQRRLARDRALRCQLLD